MKTLFWGTLFDPAQSRQLLKDSKVGLQNAANIYQWGFIEGLICNGQKNIEVVSALPVGSYPKFNKKLFFYEKEFRKPNLTVTELGFINFYLLREKIRNDKVYKWTKQHLMNEDKVVLYIYSLYLPFMAALKKIKVEFRQKVHICLIVPDLPGRYGILRNIWTPAGIWDRLIGKKSLDLSKYADSYVLLTEQMKVALDMEKPSCIVEGFFSEVKSEANKLAKSDSQDKIILYTGSFNSEFGIDHLLKSFSEIKDKNYKLWLCGPQNRSAEIINAVRKDNRIRYFGYLSKEEIAQIQQLCTLLVNPRQNKGCYVKYSFPSKIMEYLASGIPTVMYKLDGIPSEYDQFINYVGDSLKEKIIELVSKPSEELQEIGKRAKDWVINEKNSRAQVKKVLEMLEKAKI